MQKYFYRCEVFPFSELSDDAKEKALETFGPEYVMYFGYENELNETLKAFCDMLNIKLKSADWSGFYPVDYSTGNIEDHILELSGIRLMKYVYNRFFEEVYRGKYYGNFRKSRRSRITKETCCPLTGVCFDDDVLQPLIECMNGKHANTENYTFSDLIDDCIIAWKQSAKNAFEYARSEEGFRDFADSNGFFFSADGSNLYGENEIKQGA